eukprot:355813-Chlamydomonas_euryale.AAC.1
MHLLTVAMSCPLTWPSCEMSAWCCGSVRMQRPPRPPPARAHPLVGRRLELPTDLDVQAELRDERLVLRQRRDEPANRSERHFTAPTRAARARRDRRLRCLVPAQRIKAHVRGVVHGG